MRRALFAWLCAVVIGAAPASPASAQDAAPTGWSSIAFEAKSWGAPIAGWTVSGPDAAAGWQDITRAKDGQSGDYDIVWHDVPPMPERWAALDKALARLPDPAPDYEDCVQRVTDQPYGTIRLTRGATTTEIAWNAGCFDAGYAAFLAVLKDIDALVASWGKAAPAIRTESYKGGVLAATRYPASDPERQD